MARMDKCLQCNIKRRTNKNRFCSPKCNEEYNLTGEFKECIQCGFPFELSSKQSNKIYCSHNCYVNRNYVLDGRGNRVLKICTGCKEGKPVGEFYNYKVKGRKQDKRSTCKKCDYHIQAMRRYGITSKKTIIELFEKANFKCETCGSTERLNIDHCHDNGVIRGILCNECNKALGLLKDDPKTLQNLLNYLRGNNG